MSLGVGLLLSVVAVAERLPIKTYTVADGLLRDSVTRIRHDSRGFLWLCTVGGISRFDGYSFTNFTFEDGLPDRHVNDFLETKGGTILIATDGGLAKLNPTGLVGSATDPLFSAIIPDDPKAKTIEILFEDEIGTVWVGTDNGLYRLNEQFQLEKIDLGRSTDSAEKLQVNTIMMDRNRSMWIGTEDSGLFRMEASGKVEHFGKDNGLPDAHVSSLIEDKRGRIWVGLSPNTGSGLCLLVADPQENTNIVERIFTTFDGLPSSWITDLYEDEDKFWIATTRGLCLWQGAGADSVCKTYTAKNDLCDYDIWSITKDKDGNLWSGSRCGAKKWARYGFTSYTEADGTGTPLVNSIFENSQGELFASFNADNGRSVGRFGGERFELITPKFPAHMSYFGWGWQQTVWQDKLGDWWFPTGSGLFRVRSPVSFPGLAGSLPERIEINTKSKEIFRLFEDSRGDIWITTTGDTNELWRWQRSSNQWEDLSLDTGFGKGRIGISFVEDRSGNLWIGTGGDDGALIRYRDGQFRIFGREDGVPEGWLRALFVDHEGKLWIADPAAGLLLVKDVNADRLDLTRYTPADGLSSIGVMCVTEDEFGRIYVGTGRGLDRLDPVTGQVENFTTADGLPNSTVEIAYRDRHNDLWFGTTNGLARFAPEPQKARQSPNILITGLRVNGQPQKVSVLGETSIPRIEMRSDQRQVSVDFLGLGTSLGEKLRYEYRLGDTNWTAATERTVNFADLSAGEFRFEARAVTADRLYSPVASLEFRIAAPIWKQPWFVALALGSALFAVYFFYKSRFQRLLEMERMRTRIAADLHDDIGANLTRISLLSEVANQQTTVGNGTMLTSIADIARESVASMNDIVWAISPDHDRLRDLTRRMRQHAEEIFATLDIDLDFQGLTDDADQKLSVGIRRDVLLIFKEAVNNAARHANSQTVEIAFRFEDSMLALRVKDDGKGFDPTNIDQDGHGLRSMKSRAVGLGGTLTVDSSISGGTTVNFSLPLTKINNS